MDSKRCTATDENSSKLSHRDKRRKMERVVDQSKIQCQIAVDKNSTQVVTSSLESGKCDHVLSSSCFTNCLSLDLKADLHFKTETETETQSQTDDGLRREINQSSKICLDSDKMESSSTMKNKPTPLQAVTSHCKPSVVTEAKYPTAVEIDEFFLIAEKKEQKRFSDKYNFDIVNDVPMEGSYQWVRLKP